jgi:hypothetical protein
MGSKQSKPIIRDGYVWDDSLLSSFTVKSDYFLEWLENNKSFRFVPSGDENKAYTAFKDSKGYWIAQRRVNGKLRSKRLGNSERVSKMPLENFWDVAVWLAGDYQTKDDKIEDLEVKVKSLSKTIEESQKQSNNETVNYALVGSLLKDALKIPSNKSNKKIIRQALELLGDGCE